MLVMVIWHWTYGKEKTIREETRYFHFMDFFLWLAARDLLYVSYQEQDITYHFLCYTSCEALAEEDIGYWVSNKDPYLAKMWFNEAV